MLLRILTVITILIRITLLIVGDTAQVRINWRTSGSIPLETQKSMLVYYRYIDFRIFQVCHRTKSDAVKYIVVVSLSRIYSISSNIYYFVSGWSPETNSRTNPEHPSSLPVFGGVRTTRSVFYV